MVALPPELSRYAAELGGLAPPLAAALGPLVRELARLIPAPSAHGKASLDGEPTGFAGIGRRGSVERLLASEWAVAEIEPLEMLRRAADGELLYHEVAYESPTGRLESVVLFDAGPDSLGSPSGRAPRVADRAGREGPDRRRHPALGDHAAVGRDAAPRRRR